MESYIHLYEKNSEFTAAYNGARLQRTLAEFN